MLDKISVKPFFNSIYFSKKPSILHLLNVRESQKKLTHQDFDLFHPTFYNPYFLDFLGRKPFVLTVYDMITELFPDMYPGQEKISTWKIDLIQKANRIITISENTKNDIIRFCDIDENSIEVVPLGNPFTETVPEKPPVKELPEKYLLFVGKRPFYKNFDRFIRAVAYLLIMDPKLSVICAGSTPFTLNEKRLFKELEISSQVSHIPATDPVLVSLYKKALAFVYPSLYEGFGISVLEAFSCGCPAIISKTSSLPEVGGKAAIYFDPEDELSIRESIKKVIYDKSLRNILTNEGFLRVKKFTWEQTALNTLKIYKSILS